MLLEWEVGILKRGEKRGPKFKSYNKVTGEVQHGAPPAEVAEVRRRLVDFAQVGEDMEIGFDPTSSRKTPG